MSISDFVRAYCPEFARPALKTVYGHVVASYKGRRYRKYLPYYQDELSRQILEDRIELIRTGRLDISLERAKKTGMNFPYLYGICSGVYSGIVLIYDKDSMHFKNIKSLVEGSEWSDRYRTMSLNDFVNGAEIGPSELLAPVLSRKDRSKFDRYIRSLNIKNDISNYLFSIREDLQYFDVFSPVNDEVIVDAGCYNGNTALQFLEWGNGKVRHIYSFEIDPANVPKCQAAIKGHEDKITLIQKGTWSSDQTLHIKSLGGGTSIRNAGETEVHLTTIDSILQDERVTLIKMDVEGAELESLRGSKNTITKNHPRLAICVYHRAEDLWEIPGYILSLVPEYKFYLRHYSSRDYETVLYACCNS